MTLHDSEHGYYARLSSIGARADFSTTPTLSPILGRAVAGWLRQRGTRDLIEIGAGNGALARAIRSALSWRERRRLRYHIVESSTSLRAAQQQDLGRWPSWHESLPEALAATSGQADLVSNELLDAFPVRVFRREEDGWSELHLVPGDRALRESFLPAPELPDSSLFDPHQDWLPGQRLEVHQSVHHWMQDWVPGWTAGEMLTIDYGGSPAELYRRRPAGTLRAYQHHELRTGPDLLAHPGRQDLTADVNFDDLVRWGEALGLTTLSRSTQREFLLPYTAGNDRDHFLTDPHGAGEAFKVLLQAR